jgi:hypothetical protein
MSYARYFSFPTTCPGPNETVTKHATIHHDGRKARIGWSANDQKVEFSLQFAARYTCTCPAVIPFQHDMEMYPNSMSPSCCHC